MGREPGLGYDYTEYFSSSPIVFYLGEIRYQRNFLNGKEVTKSLKSKGIEGLLQLCFDRIEGLPLNLPLPTATDNCLSFSLIIELLLY